MVDLYRLENISITHQTVQQLISDNLCQVGKRCTNTVQHSTSLFLHSELIKNSETFKRAKSSEVVTY